MTDTNQAPAGCYAVMVHLSKPTPETLRYFYAAMIRLSGQRRTLAEQYFANIDLANSQHMKKLLAVFEELIHRFGQAQIGTRFSLSR